LFGVEINSDTSVEVEGEEGEAELEEAQQKSEADKSASIHTIDLFEKKLVERNLMPVLNEIMKRNKFTFKITPTYKRWLDCFDDEEDDQKKMKQFGGNQKLLNELDVNRMLRKLRN